MPSRDACLLRANLIVLMVELNVTCGFPIPAACGSGAEFRLLINRCRPCKFHDETLVRCAFAETPIGFSKTVVE